MSGGAAPEGSALERAAARSFTLLQPHEALCVALAGGPGPGKLNKASLAPLDVARGEP
jgi:hypothetical protein